MFVPRNIFGLIAISILVLSVSTREIPRSAKLLDISEEDEASDSITVENPNQQPDVSTARQNENYAGVLHEDQDDDEEDDLETVFKAFIDAAAVVEKISDDLEEGREDDTGTKKFGILSQFHPGQFLEPFGNKFSELSEAFSHPNSGFVLPRPGDLWHRIKETGANLLSGTIFGPPAAQDYPFPYRSNADGRSLREDFLAYQDTAAEQALRKVAYWREKLNSYKEDSETFARRNQSNYSGPYFFPYFLGSEKNKEAVVPVEPIVPVVPVEPIEPIEPVGPVGNVTSN